jgi:hypothetical protein
MQRINTYRRKARNNQDFKKIQTGGTGINYNETTTNFKI